MASISYSFEVSRDQFVDFEYSPDFSDILDYLEELLIEDKFKLPEDFAEIGDFVYENIDELMQEYIFSLRDYFEAEAKEAFREDNMDPYNYYGVSRSDF